MRVGLLFRVCTVPLLAAACGQGTVASSQSFPDIAPSEKVDGHTFVLIAYPGARRTFASAVNARGEVAGLYESADGKTHGFVWRDGQFETVDVPSAEFTMVRGLNDSSARVGAARARGGRERRGDIVGRFQLPDGRWFGFLRRAKRTSSGSRGVRPDVR